MFIDDYRFGRITICGRVFEKDVIIMPDRVISPWQRRQGHVLTPEDMEPIMAASPDVILVGTGNSGLMQVPAETVRYCRDRGVEIFSYTTAAAAHLYNTTPKCHKVIAAFHLTC